MRRMVLHLAAAMAAGLLYSLWSARPVWSDVALLAVLAVAVRLTWRGWAVVPGSVRAPALAFAGAYALAASLSLDPLTAWRGVLGVVAYGLLFLLAAQLLAHGVPRAMLYRALVLTAQVIIAALAAGWLVDGAPLWGYRFFYERVNSFALVTLLLFPALLVGECRRLVMAEALYVAWFSAARAGAAGLVAGLLALGPSLHLAGAAGSYRRLWRWALAGIGLAAAVGIAARPDVLADNSRFEMWTVAGRMWADSPLVGQGPSTFKRWWVAAQPAAFASGHAHSLPLNLLAETGLLGLVAGVWLAWSVLRALSRAGGPWAAAALAGTVALLTHSLFDVPTSAPYLTAAWLALVACGLAGDEPA